MILESLACADQYARLHPRFAGAFAFLRSSTLALLPEGRYPVEEGEVTAIVVKGDGKPRAEARLEAHRKFVDIQYVISGEEEMGWSPLEACETLSEPYDEGSDICFFADPPRSWITVPPGSFAIFLPTDAHAPLVSDGFIHKVILKVRVQE